MKHVKAHGTQHAVASLDRRVQEIFIFFGLNCELHVCQINFFDLRVNFQLQISIIDNILISKILIIIFLRRSQDSRASKNTV